MIYFQIVLICNIFLITSHIFIRGVIFLNNNMNNMDMASLMQLLSKMDKNELEAGLAKANKILQSKSKDEILKELNKK